MAASRDMVIHGSVSESVIITGSGNVVQQALDRARAQGRDPARMLRVLAVLAAPVYDPDRPHDPPAPLDLKAEWHRLERAVRGTRAPHPARPPAAAHPGRAAPCPLLARLGPGPIPPHPALRRACLGSGPAPGGRVGPDRPCNRGATPGGTAPGAPPGPGGAQCL